MCHSLLPALCSSPGFLFASSHHGLLCRCNLEHTVFPLSYIKVLQGFPSFPAVHCGPVYLLACGISFVPFPCPPTPVSAKLNYSHLPQRVMTPCLCASAPAAAAVQISLSPSFIWIGLVIPLHSSIQKALTLLLQRSALSTRLHFQSMFTGP